MDEIEKMSELLKKLKRVEITEYKQIETENTIDKNLPHLKYEKGLPILINKRIIVARMTES